MTDAVLVAAVRTPVGKAPQGQFRHVRPDDLALEVTSLPAVPGLCLFAFGTELVQWNGASLPLSLSPLGLPGCQLHIAPSPGASVVVPHQYGAARLSIPIPNNAALAGWSVGAQALVFDAGAPGGVGSLSNGVILLLN